MAKVMVPVINVSYPGRQTFSLDAASVFEELNLPDKDEYTYTMRVSIPEEGHGKGAREYVRGQLKAKLPMAEALRLIALLDEHDWDVSFFVDTF